MLHRQYFAILCAAFALAGSARAMDDSEERKKIEGATTLLNQHAATVIHCAQEIQRLLHPKSQEELDPKQLLKRDDTITYEPRAKLFWNALESLRSNCDALKPLLKDPSEQQQLSMQSPKLTQWGLAPQSLLKRLCECLHEARRQVLPSLTRSQTALNRARMITDNNEPTLDIATLQLGLEHKGTVLFTENAREFPPAIQIQQIVPARVCLLAPSVIHGKPSYTCGTLATLPLALNEQISEQGSSIKLTNKKLLIFTIKKTLCERLLEHNDGVVHYINGVKVTTQFFGQQAPHATAYASLQKRNGSYFLNGRLIDENIIPDGCFELTVKTPMRHNQYVSLSGQYMAPNGKPETVVHNLAVQGNRWVVYNNEIPLQIPHYPVIQSVSNGTYSQPVLIQWDADQCMLDGAALDQETVNQLFSPDVSNITVNSFINDGRYKSITLSCQAQDGTEFLQHINLQLSENQQWIRATGESPSYSKIAQTVCRLCNKKEEPLDKVRITWLAGQCYLNGLRIDPKLLFSDTMKSIEFGISHKNPDHMHIEVQQTLPDKKGEIVRKCIELNHGEWEEITCLTAHLKGSKKIIAANPQAADVRSPRLIPSDLNNSSQLKERSGTVELITISTQGKSKSEKPATLSNKLRTSSKKFLVRGKNGKKGKKE